MNDRYIDNRVSPWLALRALTHSFRFHGRSTRSEVVVFWVFGILANLMVHLLAPFADHTLPPALSASVEPVWSLALSWPFVPLLVRRLHDQGRSGGGALLWVAVAVVVAVLFTLPHSADGHGPSIHFMGFHRWLAWTPLTTPLVLIGTMAMIANLVLYLLPGTPGENRYGPDPRIRSTDETALSAAH